MSVLSALLEGDGDDKAAVYDAKGREITNTVGVSSTILKGGIAGFLYLEVLDASFSFDGVIGAFAITNDVIVIMIGLAIGAMFVRSMTIYLVKQRDFKRFYLFGTWCTLCHRGACHHYVAIDTVSCARDYHWIDWRCIYCVVSI